MSAVCSVCGANPCFAICPTQDPFHGDQAAEHDDHEADARYDDERERYAQGEHNEDTAPHSRLRDVMAGLQIFDRHGATTICAEHEIWAGEGLAPYALEEDTGEPTTTLLSFTAQELAELERSCWTWDDRYRSWHHNV